MISLVVKGATASKVSDIVVEATGYRPPHEDIRCVSHEQYLVTNVPTERLDAVIRWYNYAPGEAPFPSGTLLFYSVKRAGE